MNRLAVAIAVATALLNVTEWPTPASAHQAIHVDLTAQSHPYPLGVPDSIKPSGEAVPRPRHRARLPAELRERLHGHDAAPRWDVFTGVPGGDPGGRFGGAYMVVSGGLFQLNAWKDP